MTLAELSSTVLDAAESAHVEIMLVGALAAGTHGVPRSTRNVDVVVEMTSPESLKDMIAALAPIVQFGKQAVSDTLTWGHGHIGQTRSQRPLKVELFERQDDPFVISEFARKTKVYVPMLKRSAWLPTAEDVIVQKLRWGRPKDLEDAKDVLAVQGPETLDMPYIEKWCAEHGTTGRLQDALDGIPPL